MDPLGKKYAFILDEYYAMLESASMFPSVQQSVHGIFEVGKIHRCILSTGHYSTQFKDFLLRFLPSVNTDYCTDDIVQLKRKQNLDAVRVVCNPETFQLLDQTRIEIKAHCLERPVIVFGLNDNPDFIKSLQQEMNGKCTVFTVADADNLKVARLHFKDETTGVIFLTDAFRIGVDIKCEQDGRVIVYVKESGVKPDREQLT